MTTRTLGRRVVGALCAASVLLATVVLSRVAWQSADPDIAELRLSWRFPAPARQECRPPTEAELRGVLPHMRPSEVCTDEAIPFRLTIGLDGDTLLSEPIVRSGPRARTITVFRSFRIPSGSYALEVAFLPEPPPDPERGVADAPARDSADAPARDSLPAPPMPRTPPGPRHDAAHPDIRRSRGCDSGLSRRERSVGRQRSRSRLSTGHADGVSVGQSSTAALARIR